MTPTRFILAATLIAFWPSFARADFTGPSELAQGVSAYQDDRLKTALGHFISVLENDPENQEAQAYIKLIARKLQAAQVQDAREQEIAILSATSQLLEARRMDTRIVNEDLQGAIAAQTQRKTTERHATCTEAQMEAQLGHLAVANDLVLRVIAQDPGNEEAQRLLSDLQSTIRHTLDSRHDLVPAERFTLEGFYAYGQADYNAAATQWAQARIAAQQSYGTDADHQVALLRFDAYDQTARRHVEDERLSAKALGLFNDGLDAFQKGDVNASLENFRQVALINPEYPQLGTYLVQSEVAVERKRTSDLSDAKREEVQQAFAKGMTSLEKGDDAKAKSFFKNVLTLDPAHPQAKLYLQQIENEKPRRTDPVAGEQHYEAGLMAFVGGDMDQAIREWHIALRFDPENPKVTTALGKVQRELASSKDLP